MTNRIVEHCQNAGCYTISEGTMDPAVVLRRLLDVVLVLAPSVHAQLTTPGGKYSSIPRQALDDELSPWWSTNEASRAVLALFTAINDAAPPGFACVFEAADAIVIKACDLSGTDPVWSGSFHDDDFDSRTAPLSAPRNSAVRALVRTRVRNFPTRE